MACDITKGRGLGCKDSRIGIKSVDFAVFNDAVFTTTAGEVTAIPASITAVFRYQVKGTGNKFEDVGTINQENRTVEFKKSLSLVLPKLGVTSEVELSALLYGRVYAFVKDYNGNVIVCGVESGMDATTLNKSTDTQCYNIALEAMDKVISPSLSSTAKTALEVLVSATNVAP